MNGYSEVKQSISDIRDIYSGVFAVHFFYDSKHENGDDLSLKSLNLNNH